MNYHPLLSDMALSNLYTMGATAAVDPRQAIPAPYTVPPEETRILRARLILEEALETIEGLGIRLVLQSDGSNQYVIDSISELEFEAWKEPDLDKIIDGCCDLNYVSIGTLCACGVSDRAHMNAVDTANNAKFPGGKAVANEHGKFQKPPGWEAPNHEKVRKELPYIPHLGKVSGELLQAQAKNS